MADEDAPAEASAFPPVDPDREIVLRAKSGDADAINELWTRAIPVAKLRAEATVGRYQWLDPEDLQNDLLAFLPQFLQRYNPDNEAGNHWQKYLYFAIYWGVKDILRGEAPLGIGYPQKKHYPEWHRLGDEAFDGFEVDSGFGEPIDDAIAAEEFSTPTALQIAQLDVEILEKRSALNEISPVGRKRERAKPQKLRFKKFTKAAIKNNSLRNFLKSGKLESLVEKEDEASEHRNLRSAWHRKKKRILRVFEGRSDLNVSQVKLLAKMNEVAFYDPWNFLLASRAIVQTGLHKPPRGPLVETYSLNTENSMQDPEISIGQRTRFRKRKILGVFADQSRLTVSQVLSLTKLFRWQFRAAWDELLQSGEIIRNGKLKPKKGGLIQLFSLKGVPQMEQIPEQATAPETETNQETPPKPKKKPVKKKAATKKVAKGKPTAFDQLALAGRFADSCGGISKAIQLLTVLQSMRK